MSEELQVENNRQAHRFEVAAAGALATAEYELEPGTIIFTHTKVPPELSGRGIANRLAEAGLGYARQEKLRVVPRCAFIASYIERHPEYAELTR
jgi:predicted GNAT family acetyltransferase